MFGVLNKYIAKLFYRDLLTIFFIVAAIVLFFDIIELIRFASGNNYKVSVVFLLLMGLMKNYSTLYKLLPFVVLLATLKTYLSFSKRSELIAMSSLGISPYQLMRAPSIILAIFFVFNLLILNPLSSYLLNYYQSLEADKLTNHASLSTSSNSSSGIWFKKFWDSKDTSTIKMSDELEKHILIGDHQRIPKFDNANVGVSKVDDHNQHLIIIHALGFIEELEELVNVEMFIIDKKGRCIEKIYADKFRFIDEKLLAKKVKIFDMYNKEREKENFELDIGLPFKGLLGSLVTPERTKIWDLPKLILSANTLSSAISKYQLYFYKLIFSPISLFSMLLIGYAFSNVPMRKSNEFLFISYALATGFVLYFVNELLIIILLGSNISAIISVFIPSIMCFLISLYVMITSVKLK